LAEDPNRCLNSFGCHAARLKHDKKAELRQPYGGVPVVGTFDIQRLVHQLRLPEKRAVSEQERVRKIGTAMGGTSR
jgi:hypothetical protein